MTVRLVDRRPHLGADDLLARLAPPARFGAAQVLAWRRSYDVPPPPLAPDDPRSERGDPRYAALAPEQIPLTECLKDTKGVIVAASDYLKVLPASIDRWMPRRVRSLGTDGFGRSEARKELREFFEVEARYIALATLAELAQNGDLDAKVVAQAIKDFGINPDKKDPARS